MRGAVFLCLAIGYMWAAGFATSVYNVYQWPTLLALAICLVAAPLGIRGRISVPRADGLCQGLALALGAYMAIRALSSPIGYLARLDLILLAGLFGIYVLFSTQFVGRRERLVFAALILFAGIANTAVAIYQQGYDLEFTIRPGRDRVGSGGQLTRPSGFYNQSIHLGGFCAVASIAAAGFAVFLRGHRNGRMVAAAAFVVTFVGILLSQSRAALVMLVVGIAVLVVLRFLVRVKDGGSAATNRRLTFIVVAGIVVVVAGGLIARRGLEKRFGNDSAGLFGLTGRSNFWGGAIDQWFDWPVFGAGAQSYRYRYLQYRPADAPFHQRDPGFAHNDYLQQGAEYGTIGVLLLLAVLAAHLRNGFVESGGMRTDWRNRESGEVRLALLAVALAVLAAQMVHALIDFEVRLLATGVPIAFCLAVLANPGGSGRERQLPWAGSLTRWAGVACGLALLASAPVLARVSLAMERAHIRMAAGDSDGAIPFLHRAAELDPTNADPIRDLGLIQINRQYEDMPLPVKLQYQALALENFEKVIAIHPFDWRVHLQAAECEMSLAWGGQAEGAGGRWERARAHCERALAIAPTKWETREAHARMRLNYAQYLVGEGKFAKAYREAQASLKEFLKVPDYFVQGAPRGHRAGIGAKAAKRLLERLLR